MPRRGRKQGARQGKRVVEREWERMLAHLPGGWEGRARQHRAFERRREIQSPGDLLRIVLGAAVQGWSQRMVAAWADLAGLAQISGEAVGKRVRKARAWLSAEVGLLLHLRRDRWVGESGQARRVRLVDATTISEPGSQGTDWRVHAVIDLEAGQLCGLELTDRHGAESLVRHPIEPGEIAVADRAHARRTDFGQLLARGIDLVVRIGWRNLPVETLDGGQLDLMAWIETPIIAPAERPVLVQTPTGTYPLRLIVAPLPPAQAAEARRRCRRAAKKKGRTLDHRSLAAAGFVLLVTTLDAPAWPLADILLLYRCRWQIELLFKHLKSIWHLDQLRARDPEAIQAQLLAVILAALLAGEVGLAAPIPLNAWLDDRHHPLSRWRWSVLWHAAFLAAIRGPFDLLTLLRRLPSLRRHLCDPPRRRAHQASAARLLLRSHTSPHALLSA